MTKSYSELLHYNTFEDRLKYLLLYGQVGEDTFGSRRYLNQDFYRSSEWQSIRRKVILRDNGCDMAFPGFEVHRDLIVHHIEPITIEDILEDNPKVLDMNNLVCVSLTSHNAIHYGNDKSLLGYGLVERKPNDTCPWREVKHG